MPYNDFGGYSAHAPFGTPAYIQSGTNDIQGVNWVSSFDEVRAASVPFGRKMFMENNEQIFHIKDSNGSIMSFKFEEIPQPTPANFVTRQEFDDLRSKYESLVQQQQAAAVQQSAQFDAIAPSSQLVPGDTGASQGAVHPNDSGSGLNPGSSQ